MLEIWSFSQNINPSPSSNVFLNIGNGNFNIKKLLKGIKFNFKLPVNPNNTEIKRVHSIMPDCND